MTAIEMQIRFLQMLNTLTDVKYDLPTISINKYLNIGQHRVVTELHSAGAYERLSDIIVTESKAAVASVNTTAYVIETSTLTKEFLYYVRGRAKLTRTNPAITDNWVPIDKLTTQTDITNLIETVFNKPWFKLPKAFIEYDVTPSIVIIVDAYTETVSFIEVTYVKNPVTINIDTEVNCELNEELHQAVVDYAVQEAARSLSLSTPKQEEA